MLGLKLLHIAAVIVWCGAVVYLPMAIGAASREGPAQPRAQRLVRLVFVGVATPAALIAIASGTAVFSWQGPVLPWLMAKLVVVGALVWVHGASGFLVLKLERGQTRGLLTAARLLTAIALVLLLAIAWLVLAKPA